MRVRTIFTIFPRIVLLLFQLLMLFITFDWKVRRARRAFEKELIRQGIPKKDAIRLSKQIKIAKDRIMSSLWQFASR